MSKKDDAEVVREVSDAVDAAISKNHRTERVVVGVLIALFAVGLGLLVFGAVVQRWELLVPGTLTQLTIVLPIRKLVALRENNMRLQILPQLMRLADSKEAKFLAAQLVKRLIQQVRAE